MAIKAANVAEREMLNEVKLSEETERKRERDHRKNIIDMASQMEFD